MQYFTPHAWLLAVLSGWPNATTNGLRSPRHRIETQELEFMVQPMLKSAIDTADAFRKLQTQGLTIGFDAARARYAAGVHSGHIERSLLASAAFERKLGLLERWLLGPWARSV